MISDPGARFARPWLPTAATPSRGNANYDDELAALTSGAAPVGRVGKAAGREDEA